MKKFILMALLLISMSCEKIEQPLKFQITKFERVEQGFNIAIEVPAGKLPVRVTFHAYNVGQPLLDTYFLIEDRKPFVYEFRHKAFKQGTMVFVLYSNEQTKEINSILL